MQRTVVISQPRYLPIVSYLQRLYNADLFIFLDTVQRQGRGWENRNKILLNGGRQKWLTIPISSSSREAIDKTVIAGTEWIEHHKNAIKCAYHDHPYFNESLIDASYDGVQDELLENKFNYRPALVRMLTNICAIFEFSPQTAMASEYDDGDFGCSDRLLNISRNAKADIYVSGANGRSYGVQESFAKSEILVKFHNFPQPTYTQFNSSMSYPCLCFWDVIFNVGLDETSYLIKEKWSLSDS
ncbi:MAG: WbqC family protein [Holosporaceae bacterium]|nr:WbqC family protein [Holosporaceae bacterium]